MINIKNIYKQVFNTFKQDSELLDLLEIEYENVDRNTFLENMRKQVVEMTAPDDILNDYSTRVCVHETSAMANSYCMDISYIAIDVHISKDRNVIDGRLNDIVNRIVLLLDSSNRKRNGKEPLNVGLYGLNYNKRVMEEQSGNTGWEKYRLIFEIRSFI